VPVCSAWTLSALLGASISRCAGAYARIHVALSRGLERGRISVQAILAQSITAAEKSAMTRRIYDQNKSSGPRELYGWERVWYGRDLPPAPARVLVGGCGSGRELLALEAAGYEVRGFEPAESLYRAARARLGETKVTQMSYEDLLSPVQHEILSAAPYDAVISGWGSFSHVLEQSRREQVLLELQRLCPTGPILLSFHLAERTSSPRAAGPLEARAMLLGGILRNIRGIRRSACEATAVFLPHAGFLHRFTEAEIDGLAALVGRRVHWGDDRRTYPHCSLLCAARGLPNAS
jgi:SAM-dependent methyltransferase